MKERMFAGGIALVLCGCTVEVPDGLASSGDEELGQVEQTLTSHAVRNKRGVVELQLDGLAKCTGVMINSKFVLTAARCVWEQGEPKPDDFTTQAKLSYFDPDLDDGEKREVTEGWDQVNVYLHPNAGNDDGSLWALALIRRSGGWLGTGTSDYQRISQGSCTNIDVSSFYGRGSAGSQGPSGTLRVMSVNVDECTLVEDFVGWFEDEGPYAACPGDYGGPYIGRAGEHDVITGILTWAKGGTEACADGGREQAAEILTSRSIEWIEDIINDTCHYYVVEHHEYVRCWD